MFYLVTYDIPSTGNGDRRRARLSKRLEGFGLRVQYSVFEIEISPERLPAIIEELELLLELKEDSLRLYPFCGTCRDKTVKLGKEATVEHSSLLIW